MKQITPDPVTVSGIAEQGLAGYLRDQERVWAGTWYEWECGENDEEVCGAWDGDTEKAEWFSALAEAAEALTQRAALAEKALDIAIGIGTTDQSNFDANKRSVMLSAQAALDAGKGGADDA